MSRRTVVFVVQLDARAGSRWTETVKFEEPNTSERTPVFRWQALLQMWKTFVNAVRPKQRMRIEEVDGLKQEDYAKTWSSRNKGTGKN